MNARLPSTSASVSELSDENFENQVLRSDQPVLVDFFATWCGPCKHMSPLVDELASSYGGRVKVFRADVDKCPQLSAKFAIRAIPTFITFKNGNTVSSKTGVFTREELTADLDGLLR
jgi:thioredoxin 1